MLNFEALTLPARGWSEIGQSAEGAYDTQPPRQLVDRALIALHLLGREEGAWRAVLWGGRGAATFGGPSHVSRASNPSPSMPRKHHVGEVPDTASPVVGATVEYDRSILEGSWFSARTPSLADSHLQPRVHSPRSLALRLRRRFGVPTASFEAQASAAHLVDRGNDLPDAWQLSTSLQAHVVAADFFVDILLDGAIEPGKMGLPRNEGAALEVALRDHSRRDSLWTRVELIDRIERGGWMSQDWWFVSLGFERVVWCDSDDTLGIGVFGEATVTWIPQSKRAELGSAEGATLAIGVRGRLLADVRHPSR